MNAKHQIDQINQTNMTYSEYTTCVGTDPVNYGDCTPAQAKAIADRIQTLIESEYPGIQVRLTSELGAPTPTTGPDQSVCDEIHEWIESHWTAAL